MDRMIKWQWILVGMALGVVLMLALEVMLDKMADSPIRDDGRTSGVLYLGED